MQEKSQPFHPFDVVDIIGLTVKRGAHIGGPVEAQAVSRWRPCTSAGTRFLLETDEDTDAVRAAEIVTMAGDHLRVLSRSRHVMADPLSLELDLRCNSSSLEQFIHAVSQLVDVNLDIADHLPRQFASQPFFLNLIVHLSDITTLSTMQRYITYLADAYKQFYEQHHFDPADEEVPFVIVRSRSASVHQRYLSRSSPDWLEKMTEKHSGGYSAELVVGGARSWQRFAADGYAPRRAGGLQLAAGGEGGFTAVIYEILIHKGNLKSQRSVWQRAYPEAHAPIVAVEAREETQA
jgi:hypothetical protein